MGADHLQKPLQKGERKNVSVLRSQVAYKKTIALDLPTPSEVVTSELFEVGGGRGKQARSSYFLLK